MKAIFQHIPEQPSRINCVMFSRFEQRQKLRPSKKWKNLKSSKKPLKSLVRKPFVVFYCQRWVYVVN